MKLAIGYIRVSSQGQAAEGISLEAQEAKIKAWAQYNEYELLGVLRDNGRSGFKMTNRPGAQKAILLACEHKAALVVYSLSRLCRNRRDLLDIGERLKKAQANLVSLTEQIDTTTAMGNGFFGFLAVMNQIERDLASERTKSILAHLRAEGKRNGCIPYGYMADPNRPEKRIENRQERVTYPYLIACPEEQAIIAEIKRLKSVGYSTARIAAELDKKGLKARKHKAFQATQIKRIIRRPISLSTTS